MDCNPLNRKCHQCHFIFSSSSNAVPQEPIWQERKHVPNAQQQQQQQQPQNPTKQNQGKEYSRLNENAVDGVKPETVFSSSSSSGAGSVSDHDDNHQEQEVASKEEAVVLPEVNQLTPKEDSADNFRWDGTPLDGKQQQPQPRRPMPRQRSMDDKAPRPPKRESSMPRRREEIN